MKKLLSILIALSMILTIVPASVFAEDGNKSIGGGIANSNILNDTVICEVDPMI